MWTQVQWNLFKYTMYDNKIKYTLMTHEYTIRRKEYNNLKTLLKYYNGGYKQKITFLVC